MNSRAFRLNDRIAAAYSARSPRRLIARATLPASEDEGGGRRPTHEDERRRYERRDYDRRVRAASAILGIAVMAACAAPPEREINVGLMEYAFLPARIEVATGERIRFALKNTGRMEHDFATDERGRALGIDHVHLGVAGTATRDWTAPSTIASIKVICTLPGHEQLGMVAMLVVVQRAGATPTR
jgi:uncharacterized cupredoxin-like copper-binding protein